MAVPTAPVRIFEHLDITYDAERNEVHTGTYVEFHRPLSTPKPATIGEALAILRSQIPASLRSVVDRSRTGTPAQRAIATLREIAADARAAAWKTAHKYADRTGSVKPKDDVTA